MRYLNYILGLILHSVILLLAYVPLYMHCIDLGLYATYPIIILFWLLSINEILLAITPPSVMVLPVCSFTVSIIIGLFMTNIYPWIHPFLIIGSFIFVFGLLIQFLINLVWITSIISIIPSSNRQFISTILFEKLEREKSFDLKSISLTIMFWINLPNQII